MPLAPGEPDPEEKPPRSMWLDPTSPWALRHAAAIVAVAFLTAGFGILFRGAATFVFRRLFDAGDVVTAFEALPPLARLPIVAVGGLVAGTIGVLATRHRGGQGVGGVMEAVALGEGRISLRASLWKALGCFCAIVSGSSIGREGPIIQFGGAIGGQVATLFRMHPDRVRILVAAGSAAGFASAYNTPFAAVLFVLEVVLGVVTLDVVLATVLCTAISTGITRLVVGGGPIYGARTFAFVSNRELVGYLVLGALAGVVGTAFNAVLVFAERAFAKAPLKQPFTAFAGAIFVGALAVVLPEITGNGYEVINRILDGALAMKIVVVLLFAKLLATGASVGSGTPGGAFTPSLFLGAALGGLVGHALALVAPHHTGGAGAYALVGMAAASAATTHAPLMAAVLVFELSGDYGIVLPLLVATATATLVARRIRPTSVYMDELARRGLGWTMTFRGRDVRRA